MEAEEADVVYLHYKMLEYVYEKQVLPVSCHNFVWEDFKTQNDVNHLSCSKL